MEEYMLVKPQLRPKDPRFSSGPCVKRPGWDSQEIVKKAVLGRALRSSVVVDRINLATALTKELLLIPDDYSIAVVTGSDTGAFEMALWSLLGERGVDILAWENFGFDWAYDIEHQLKLADFRCISANYGEISDLSKADFNRDVIFTWNGTSSGVKIPNEDFIPATRQGLTFCDATSAAFGYKLDFSKLDVTTFSWQKLLGGEAGHAILVLSPRAIHRLQTHIPAWPIPKLFRLAENGQLLKQIFAGMTINTTSLWCVEDYIDALQWIKAIGGLSAFIARVEENYQIFAEYMENTPWLEYLCKDPSIRSHTSVTVKLASNIQEKLSLEQQKWLLAKAQDLLAKELVALDIASHAKAPLGLRIWLGGTVEAENVRGLVQWLDWAFVESYKELQAAYGA